MKNSIVIHFKKPMMIPCALILLVFSTFNARSQFNSGSTGADGALDLATCPTATCEVQLPESGVLNYTTVNIPGGKVLRFKKNSRNTPVYLLSQGDVNIVGTVEISAIGNVPGPGGFYGGKKPPAFSGPQSPGWGPGGGEITGGPIGNGRWVGPLSLVPLVGGSGGASSSFSTCCQSYAGGGGGGAILIASSSTINVAGSGRVYANGAGAGGYYGGSGGAVRLVATNLLFAGSITATSTNNGTIRLEGENRVITGSTNPIANLGPINPVVVPSAMPSLSFSTIGGYAVPAYAGTRFDYADLTLPNQIPDPIPVVVLGANIPVGTEVRVGFLSGSPNGVSTPCNLAGTFAASSCTAGVSNLTRTGGTYLLATAAFDPPASVAKVNPTGKNNVAKVVVESPFGAAARYKFLRKDGTEVVAEDLPREFLKEFGITK